MTKRPRRTWWNPKTMVGMVRDGRATTFALVATAVNDGVWKARKLGLAILAPFEAAWIVRVTVGTPPTVDRASS